jgi:hypothetical protein
MRALSSLTSALNGGIHEGIAPRKVRYPFISYQLASSVYDYTFDTAMLRMLFDISVFAENPVDANNIDALVSQALNEAELTVSEQTNLLCRRVSDLPTGPDIDSEGKRIYQVGGTYSVWTHQTL